jgi:hypothetical protein
VFADERNDGEDIVSPMATASAVNKSSTLTASSAPRNASTDQRKKEIDLDNIGVREI